MKSAFLALIWALPSLAFAARPTPPVVTLQANTIKQLEFEWQPLTGVTKYQLWFKANDDAAWVKYLEKAAPRTSMAIGVAVHLLDWPEARYQLKACNAEGCSTSNTVRARSEKLVAMGYFKPETPADATVNYGGQVALSADGATMAVHSGDVVNGNNNSLVIYVYRKTAAGWHREARLVPSTVQPFTAQPYLADMLSLSRDGNLLAVGSWYENGPGDSAREAGAVYLFRRSGTTWREAQKITRNVGGDDFGHTVKLDDAGQTLVVAHRRVGEFGSQDGTVEVYRDPNDGSGQFQHDRTVNVPVTNGVARPCRGPAFSGDGQTMLRTCSDGVTQGGYLQALKAPGFSEVARITLIEGQRDPDVSYDGSVIILANNGAATIFRLGPGGLTNETRLSSFGALDSGGPRRVAISRDGKIAAIGVPSDVAAGLGPIFPPYQTAETDSGGAVIHERRSAGWVLRRLVKPGSTNPQDAGFMIALGDNGRVLAVGAPFDPSAASGIDGDRDDDAAYHRGAVWLY
ncbi:MAG TPA: hypothetical protein VFZ95_10775 [Steroidobacteraceae bacterium]